MRSPSSKHLSPLTKLNHFDEVLDTTGDRQGSQNYDQSECDRTFQPLAIYNLLLN